ncbi:MAG TPA: 2-amino-4-hydroxy-6-hydroxymethyldihydropteridine diphosphokinase [Gammaproteobacteria bacterium]
MDKIFIEDLQIDTVIGIYDWERRIRQVISLDIEMDRDIRPASASDAIEDTLNYKEVAKRLIAYVQNSRFELIESLIERVAEIILYEFGIVRVKVRLNKPGAVRYSRNVGVEIVRERQAGTGRDIYIGIGSNVNPGANLRSGLAMLENEFGVVRGSAVYRNPAVGFDGEDFYNLAVQARTALPPLAVNRCLGLIEALHGRDRSAPKFAARTLDLDLLLYGDLVAEGDGLKLPRADITRYAFVLKPLAELAPGLVHPKEGRTLQQLWDSFQSEHAMTAVKLEDVDL